MKEGLHEIRGMEPAHEHVASHYQKIKFWKCKLLLTVYYWVGVVSFHAAAKPKQVWFSDQLYSLLSTRTVSAVQLSNQLKCCTARMDPLVQTGIATHLCGLMRILVLSCVPKGALF